MQKQEFERLVMAPGPDWLDEIAPAAAAIRAMKGPAEGPATALAAALLRAGFAAPDLIEPVYDRLAAGFGLAPAPDASEAPHLAEIPREQWRRIWHAIEWGPTAGAKGITEAVTVALGAAAPGMGEAYERAARRFPGVAENAANYVPLPYNIETLSDCAPDTLGAAFYRLIVDNGFDVEVLDREALALADLPPALRFTNTRILQTHDLFHLVAGYETTALHEIGISAFQLAQFGHAYSAAFLGVVAAITARTAGAGGIVFFDTVARAWAHGRETPAMIALPWETMWHEPIAAIRHRCGIQPFVSPFPADVIEQARAA